MNKVDLAMQSIQDIIENATKELTDEEYLEVLEETVSYVEACIMAKKEDMDK